MKNNPSELVRKKRLPIGLSDFRKLRENDCHYTDKSLLIRDVVGAYDEVLLFPRPRRFGKTLNLSMLRYFFEKSDEDRSTLFDGLAVRDDPLSGAHQGKYPVIWMTFKDAKALSWENMCEGLCGVIAREVERHREILGWKDISPTARTQLISVLERKASERAYQESLMVLSEQLSRYHNKQVVILIDEYDTPLHAGYAKGYYEEIISFLRNFLSGGLKDNEHLFRGVVTGILRVAKESVFSGLNNLGVYTILEEEFGTAFGFTETEVRCLLDAYDLSDRWEEVSHWYDGYLFGDTVIFNPWSVLNYVAKKGRKARPYWVNTASTEIIDDLATRGGRELREEIGLLLEGGSITKPVYDSIVMRDLEKRDNLLWSFLLFSGYLRCAGGAVRKNFYELMIPNEEVRLIYEDMVDRWFAEKTDSNQLEEMLMALETGDVRLFGRMLRRIVTQVMSYHDLAGEPEKVYHALVLGMLVWMSGKYDIRSNRESGYGRYDLMLKPKDVSRQGIIIEFKKVDEEDEDKETPETALKHALEQIEARQYAAELEAAGITDILKLAIAFRGKELWVRQG